MRLPNQLFRLRSVLSAIPHIEGFGTIVPISEQEFSMDDDIWDFLGYVEYDDE